MIASSGKKRKQAIARKHSIAKAVLLTLVVFKMWQWQRAHTSSSYESDQAAPSAGMDRFPRLAVVSICDMSKVYARHTISLNKAYCHKFGCDFITFPCRGKGFGEKIDALLEVLNRTNASESDEKDNYKYDYAIWVDCDAAFVNPNISPQRILSLFEPSVGLVLSRHADNINQALKRFFCAIPRNPYTHRCTHYFWNQCNINAGVIAVQRNPQGISLLKQIQSMPDTQLDDQLSIDKLVWQHYQQRLRQPTYDGGIKVVYGDVMNRHLPPIDFDEASPSWTLQAIRKHRNLSPLPTLVVHPYGQVLEIRDAYFECVATQLGITKEEDNTGTIANTSGTSFASSFVYGKESYSNPEELVIDHCAHHFRNWICTFRTEKIGNKMNIQQCRDLFTSDPKEYWTVTHREPPSLCSNPCVPCFESYPYSCPTTMPGPLYQ